MLKLSLHQFLGLAVTVGNMIPKHGFKENEFKQIQLFIGDPAPNGDITIDVKCPKEFVLKS